MIEEVGRMEARATLQPIDETEMVSVEGGMNCDCGWSFLDRLFPFL